MVNIGTDARMVFDTDGDHVSKKLADHTTQFADSVTRMDSVRIDVKHPPTPLVACKGNGTTDDTTALQALINFAQSNNGILFLPSGIYLTSSTLTITSSILIEGEYEKGDVGSGGSLAKGAQIKYTGTGTAINVTTGTGTWVYALKIKGLRIGSTGNADKGIALNGVSESDILDVHFNGGFNSALYLNSATILNVERCDFSANKIGILFDYTVGATNVAINVYGNNFWQNSIAHIKMFLATSVNIFGNWLEYSPIALWLDNDSAGGSGSFTHVKFVDNEVSVGDAVTYPNSKSVKVTASNLTKQITVNKLMVQRNLLYNSSTDYVIQCLISGAANGSYCYGKVSDNFLWGGQTASINADSGNVSLEVSGNENRNGYYGSTVTETSGTGKYIGISKQYDYLQVTGPLRLSQGIQSGAPAAGDLYWSTTTSTPRIYDGTANRILAFCDSGTTASRPTTNLYVGRFYYDTTLNKPVWMKSTSPATWVDSTGTTV